MHVVALDGIVHDTKAEPDGTGEHLAECAEELSGAH